MKGEVSDALLGMNGRVVNETDPGPMSTGLSLKTETPEEFALCNRELG